MADLEVRRAFGIMPRTLFGQVLSGELLVARGADRPSVDVDARPGGRMTSSVLSGVCARVSAPAPADATAAADAPVDADAALARSRRIAVRYELHAVVPHRDSEISLRTVYVHMIEEIARHAGHADILREMIDDQPMER